VTVCQLELREPPKLLKYPGYGNYAARMSRRSVSEFTPRISDNDFEVEVATFTDGGATAVTGCFVTDPQLGEIADVA
jgi:hypothetical protein